MKKQRTSGHKGPDLPECKKEEEMQCKKQFFISFACFLLLVFAVEALADGPAWERFEYDLARTHYYPYGSSYEISFDDFQPAWIAPVATQVVLTGDINGDGKLEIVSWDAPNIRVFDNEGQELWTIPISGFVREPSLLDATGDGIPEIAVGRRTSSDSLQILVYDGSGTLLKTIGKTGGYDSNIRPWLAADCNSDGTIEILAIQDAAWSNEPRGVSLFDYETGQEFWYYDMGPQIGTAAVGDIDEDGDLEVIKDASTVFNGAWGCGVNGQNTCTYDNAVATIVVDACTGDEAFTKFYSPERGWLFHAVVDLDRGGDANILCFRGHDSYYPGTMNILLLDDQGDTLSTWAYDGPENRFARGGGWAIADVDADSREEIIVCDCNALYGVTTDYTMRIIDDDLSQQVAVNETIVNADNNRVTINVTDLNGDGSNDILVTDYQNGKLRVLDNTLNEIWSYEATNIQRIALSDLNDDGIPEIILAADSLIVLSAPRTLASANLDIKPGSCPNPLNLRVRGAEEDTLIERSTAAKRPPGVVERAKAVLPAAILGTADFDVTDIEPATLMLEGVPALHWNVEDVSTPVGEDAEECECNTLGPDGYPDLTLKFGIGGVVRALGAVYDGDTIPLTITGELTDGTAFEGTDCVVIHVNYVKPGGFMASEAESPEVSLLGNYPNPFNPTTDISFSLPAASHVKLEVYNIMGQKVATVIDRFMEAGTHTVKWDGSKAASGVYLYRLEAGEFTETRKMMLLK